MKEDIAAGKGSLFQSKMGLEDGSISDTRWARGVDTICAACDRQQLRLFS